MSDSSEYSSGNTPPTLMPVSMRVNRNCQYWVTWEDGGEQGKGIST